MEIEIRVFEPGYDKKEFYGIMGDPLTMPEIRKELPYLINSRDMVWFLAFKGEELVGFAAVDLRRSRVVLKNHYVYPEHRKNGVFKRLLAASLDYAARWKLPITVAVAGENTITTYRRLGFKEERRTKNYIFMRKEA